jgi:hypothetical protein
MRRLVQATALFLGLLAGGVALDGCNKQSVTVQLRSLQDSTEETFVCRSESGDNSGRGLALDECPDIDTDPPTRRMYAVLTQVSTDEIAIVDIPAVKVVDVDPAVPGYTFLRLPSRPGAITTTPGGDATFVGLTSTGKTGISAIPTSCLGPPGDGQRARDLTTFAACSLSSAPGDMVVMVEPKSGSTVAETCADPNTAENATPPGSLSIADDPDNGRDCPANLTTEHGPEGRRKLVVALPETGELAVIDAQRLLDRVPGSFEPCEIEKTIALNSSPDTSGQSQSEPPDLANGCTPRSPM